MNLECVKTGKYRCLHAIIQSAHMVTAAQIATCLRICSCPQIPARLLVQKVSSDPWSGNCLQGAAFLPAAGRGVGAAALERADVTAKWGASSMRQRTHCVTARSALRSTAARRLRATPLEVMAADSMGKGCQPWISCMASMHRNILPIVVVVEFL